MTEPTVRPGWDTGDWTGLPPVAVHPYDPAWAERYRFASQAIVDALVGLDVRVEHVGSTAVPGLAARNGIDILVGLRDMADAEACVERLQALGYRYHFSKQDWVHLSGGGHKLHLSPLGGAAWNDLIRFRDRLRADPETAAAYHRLKQQLARDHGADGAAYVRGKTAFVRAVLDQALARASDAPEPPDDPPIGEQTADTTGSAAMDRAHAGE